MNVSTKNKNVMEAELDALRAHVLFLEQERQRQTDVMRENARLDNLLQERIRELNCHYGVAKLIEQHEDSIDKILQGVVELMPHSWRHPDSACARIRFRGKTYQTDNFKLTRWRLVATITAADQFFGEVEVCYLKKQAIQDEGPFLKEERLLIDAVSDRIVYVSEKIDNKQQLQTERQSLQDANAALHDALIRIQQEKKLIGVSIQANIDKIISPILFALKSGLSSKQLTYANLLQKNLNNIVGPFVELNQISLAHLSPVELLISNMIKHGLTTKEIAEMRGISPNTVNRHREHIRHKLGLANRKVNLVSFLNSVPEK